MYTQELAELAASDRATVRKPYHSPSIVKLEAIDVLSAQNAASVDEPWVELIDTSAIRRRETVPPARDSD
jgi:hypothetical protein